MATTAFLVPNFDPNKVFDPSRTLSGPVLTGNITLDTLFGGVPGAPLYGRWIYVGATGAISYVKYDGTTQVLQNIVAGVWHPIWAIMVNSTGTSATGLVWGS